MQQYMLQIIEHLGKKGYKKLNPDSNNVYGRAEGDAIYVIVLGNSRNLKADNLIKFNSQIRNDLEETGKRVMILNLLLTKDGIFDDDLSTIIKKMDNVWLFSEDYGKLYIFENQPADFDGLQRILEKEIYAEKDHWRIRLKEIFGVVTPILVLLNILVFIAYVYTRDAYGYSFLEEILTDNLRYVLVEKQYYRLLTSMFFHFSLTHLLSNMVVLIALGARVEYLLGKVKYICVYLFCGIVASVCSIVSCYMGNFYEYAGGASGAICGLMGILIVFAFFGKGKISDISLKDLIFLSVITILNGYVSEGIDNAAHIGGLIAGLFTGLLCAYICSKKQNSGI